MRRVLVTGGAGFIGCHLVDYLRSRRAWVRVADIRKPEFGPTRADEFLQLDLRDPDNCLRATAGIDDVYALAADMGGIGYISKHHATIIHNNALINLNTLHSAHTNGVRRYLLASSACVYPAARQSSTDPVALREEDAYPADPPTGYGWEKLTAERALTAYADEYGLAGRIVRLHNVYGPRGAYRGGREKAPAALCRKVALAAPGGVIDIWGDGRQTRSFCYVSDCVEGLYRIMSGEHRKPINLGSDHLISIADLARLIIDISGKPGITLRSTAGPQGVRGRNSDNTVLRELFSWAPSTSLDDGMRATYAWIAAEISRAAARHR